MKENSNGTDTNVGTIGNSIEEDIEILDLCREYTIKLLELQKVKTKGVNLFEPSKEKKCELAMIDKSIEYLRRNKWKIV